jgi:hypothetical protein
VDQSGLIFVALAIAWAAYLIPQALRHHDDAVRGRSVDRFSHSMRVLARREPVSARKARLVVTAETERARPATPDEQHAARRTAARAATRRRRRVLSVLLLGLIVVVALSATGRLVWASVAIPAALLVAWLVACRLMVRRERDWQPVTRTEAEQDAEAVSHVAATGTHAAVSADAADAKADAPPARPGMWDPVPVTLPTYVSKPAARRSVRTIDLDSTGVWTSGRTEADSALAREAEAADRVRRRVSRKGDSGEEAVGS